MGLLGSVIHCLRHPFLWRTRATRAEYWWFQTALALVAFPASTIWLLPELMALAGGAAAGLPFAAMEGTAALLVQKLQILGLVWIWPGLATLAATIRRFHDTGRSGWWFFIGLVPLVGGIWVLVLTVLPSEPRANRWGPAPEETAAQHARRMARLEAYMQPKAEIDVHRTPDAIRALRHARMPQA